MCLLIAKPCGVALPDNLEEICKEAAEINDDGFGFATIRRVWKHHKITPDMFAKILRRAIKPDDNAIIHFRYSTGGYTNRLNCHPYRLNDGTIFAHNGNISYKYKPHDGFSDTATLAMTATDLADLYRRCKEVSGPGNKFAMINGNLPKEAGIVIVGEEHGTWEKDGMWYSNDYWRRGNRRRGYSYTYTTSDTSTDVSTGYYNPKLVGRKLSDWEEAELKGALFDLVEKHGFDIIRAEVGKNYPYTYQNMYNYD